MCTLGLTKPKVIIYMDGGICSQMHVYLCGEQYRRSGLKVLYDTYWFDKDGKDLDGRFERNLELGEMFPDLPLYTIRGRKGWYYRNFFSVPNCQCLLPSPESIRRTSYLGGFYHLFPNDEFKSMFVSCFGRDAMGAIPLHIPINKNGTNCAVHVRRGDLANRDEQFYKDNPWYKPLSNEYFLNAIKYVSEHYPNVRFYFFSEELDWVETNLCSRISAPYQLMRGNKGYVDLALIAECDVIIGSQGAFGKQGARLNGGSDVLTPAPETEQGFEIKNFSKEVF